MYKQDRHLIGCLSCFYCILYIWIYAVSSPDCRLSSHLFTPRLNQSGRAKRLLADSGLFSGEDEIRGVNSVFHTAALTYVAALFAAIMQVLDFASDRGNKQGVT